MGTQFVLIPFDDEAEAPSPSAAMRTAVETVTKLVNDTILPAPSSYTSDLASPVMSPESDAYYGASYNDSSSSYGASYGYDDEQDKDKGDPYGYYEDAKDPYGPYGKGDKKKEYGEDFFYGAMSVAVLTLGLVIAVEFILHQIDHSAVGKPFYQAVLDAVYRELAVLGIVEFGVYVMQQYYEYDKDKKAVFADVHFLLFYTDIFNALQAVVQAYATSSISNRLWVRTEELELDHYVEIREEYDRIHAELYGPNGERSGWVNALGNTLFKPALKAKYNELLLQVRFHELRVYFLQAYKLPLKLKVSDYLMRAEQNVLISLVHVSPIAWLWLTALCNLLYYCAGLIADRTGDSNDSATFYSMVFFVGMVLFVVIAFLVDKSMHRIFNRIMKSKHLWAFDNGEDYEVDEDLATEQRNLFFLGDPQIIVTIIQVMQFGYAIFFSIVIIYWNDMKDDDFAHGHWYLWGSALCYMLFVYQMARVIPRYTLCTSLGQLVNKHLLHETVAAHKLKEAERFRTQKHDDEEDDERGFFGWSGGADDTTTAYTETGYTDTKKDSDSDVTIPSSSEVTTVASATNVSSTGISPAPSATDLVSMDTSALKEAAIALKRQKRSMARRKAKSEGVALMRQVTIQEMEVDVDKVEHNLQKSNSEGVDLMNLEGTAPSMRRSTVTAGDLNRNRALMMADFVKMDTQTLRNVVGTGDMDRSAPAHGSSSIGSGRRKSLSGGASRRQRSLSGGTGRRKTLSGGVAAMAAVVDDIDEVAVAVPTEAERAARRASRRKSNSAGSAIRRMRQPSSSSTSLKEKSLGFSADDDDSVALSEVDSAHSSDRHHPEDEHKEPFSLHKWLCEFFVGSTFRLTSQVGGTMICFFLVGMRIEGFLQKACVVPADDFSWDLPLYWTFVLEGAWLIAALTTTVLLLLTLSCKSVWKRDDWNAVVGAILNLGIVGGCLGLLIYSEMERCCSGGDKYDYEDAKNGDGELDSMYYDSRFLQYGDALVCKDETAMCKCDDFGYRVSGGLGMIEPWTALIALQIFRFIVAKKITKLFGLGEKEHHHLHGHDDHGHGHGHGHGGGGPEAVADAWQTAVAKHPELVEKYGEFSGEVLQAMLGLEVIERRKKRDSISSSAASHSDADKGGHHRGSIVLKDKRHSTLCPEAQEIIAAGMVGKPVRIRGGEESLRKLGSSMTAPMAPLEFEIDTKQNRLENLQLTTTFEFPNARIIRSVRRCDKMYHPLLKKWTAVDVILTKHEMVYVDVNETCASADIVRSKACRDALVATKGGKGLRLCDVTANRRVLGHLSLDDITAVHVDREMAQMTGAGSTRATEVDVDEEATKFIHPHEMWQSGGDAHFDGSLLSDRWNEITQDKLKIETHHGTLYLRFYSDLVESELHPERNKTGEEAPVIKDIAFQWAQTIVHICVDQLKQSLPNYGSNTSDELKDYLHMVSC